MSLDIYIIRISYDISPSENLFFELIIAFLFRRKAFEDPSG